MDLLAEQKDGRHIFAYDLNRNTPHPLDSYKKKKVDHSHIPLPVKNRYTVAPGYSS